jgi:hypothetical protein
MLDIIDKFNVLQLCFNQGSNTVNKHTSIGEQCIDSSLQLEDGSPMQSQYSTRVQPHDDAMTEMAHDDNMTIF